MKTVYLFSLLLALVVFGCTKLDNDSISVDSITNKTTVDINPDLIIGRWQLTDIGKNSPSKQTTWTKTTTSEILEFKSTGAFTKKLKDWSNCEGSFKIINSRLVTNSMCQVEENITELTQTALVFDTQNGIIRYKYTRMW